MTPLQRVMEHSCAASEAQKKTQNFLKEPLFRIQTMNFATSERSSFWIFFPGAKFRFRDSFRSTARPPLVIHVDRLSSLLTALMRTLQLLKTNRGQ